jgi:hypothetical protein
MRVITSAVRAKAASGNHIELGRKESFDGLNNPLHLSACDLTDRDQFLDETWIIIDQRDIRNCPREGTASRSRR